MEAATSAEPMWLLNGTVGKLACGRISGEVDVARPHLGLRCEELARDANPGSILGAQRGAGARASESSNNPTDEMQWPLPVAEVYVRETDLVSSYRPIDDWPYSPQMYWQANSLNLVEGVQGSLTLLVSVQTHLLDTFPKISVRSQLPSAELQCISINEDWSAHVQPLKQSEQMPATGLATCVLQRLRTAPLSYIEIAPVTDFRDVLLHCGSDGVVSTHWHLFADFLEKGVIRRARIYAALLPRENDIELAMECCRALEQSPLPLTT